MQQAPLVLVVDDDNDILNLCGEILKTAGYRVITARHGQAALDALALRHVDLVLMDIMMPTMNGVVTCEAIRANRQTQDMPIVVMSAASNLQDLAPRVMRLASAVVAKPFDIEALLRTVARFVPAQPSQNSSLT